jgi:hypothetical protein
MLNWLFKFLFIHPNQSKIDAHQWCAQKRQEAIKLAMSKPYINKNRCIKDVIIDADEIYTYMINGFECYYDCFLKNKNEGEST